jgi:hypothetical protein
MAFNFKQYTSNNPLLQQINEDEDPIVSNVDAYAQEGGLDEEDSKFPRVEFEEAVIKALKAGIDRDTLHKIIDWN